MSDHSVNLARGQNRLFKVLLVLLVLISSRAIIYADPPSSPTQGGRPAGSYDLSGFDNVNLFNGNLNFKLPLLKIGGRGGGSFSLPLIVETRWEQQGVSIKT